jgi:L-fucose mutarotase
MLKNFDNRLNADVIRVLRAMGHGDDIVIADTNFPADSTARQTVTGKLLRMDNLTAAETIEAILSVFPLDAFVDHPAARMGITGDEAKVLPVHHEVQKVLDKAEGKSTPLGIVSRFDFYERANKAYAVIVTGESRFYGCFVLKKGVIPPKDA